MATEKRLKILTEAETTELFGPPILNSNDQRFFFTLNEIELAQGLKIRRRDQRCMFVLLGYFKVKPVTLSPGYHQIKHDIKYVCSEVFPGSGLSPFNLTQKTRIRIYHRIFELAGYQRWESKRHSAALAIDLSEYAQAWAQPRSLFDRAIEYLSALKIGIRILLNRREFHPAQIRSQGISEIADANYSVAVLGVISRLICAPNW